MSFEAGNKNLEHLQKIFKDIEGLTLANPEKPEFIALSREASAVFSRAMLAFSRQDGWENFIASFEKLKVLYTKAMDIRASQLYDDIGRAMGVRPQEIESSLLSEIDKFKENGLIRSNVTQLERMARGLGVDPATVLSGANIPNNCYYGLSGEKRAPEIVVQLATVKKDEDLIPAVTGLRRDVMPVASELEPLLSKLEAGLRQLRAYNLVHTQMFDWAVNFENNKNQMDTRPLRLLGAVAGGLLSGVGLATNLITGSPVTWPTFAWAGIAAYSMYPDFAKGNGGKERAFIAQFTQPKMKNLMGHFNVEAFEELQALRKISAMKKLISGFVQSNTSLSAAQIGALTDEKKTPLAKVLSALPPNMVVEALKFFSQLFTAPEKETITILMRRA